MPGLGKPIYVAGCMWRPLSYLSSAELPGLLLVGTREPTPHTPAPALELIRRWAGQWLSWCFRWARRVWLPGPGKCPWEWGLARWENRGGRWLLLPVTGTCFPRGPEWGSN